MSIEVFNPILNWKLLKGSHEFPGPDGGTCINEAAVVAAGFKYRKISSVKECPPCFSRIIASYALHLNDSMPHIQRQLLLPFVMKMSGTADSADVEKKRAELIALSTVNRILPIGLRKIGLLAEASDCESARTLLEAIMAATKAEHVSNYLVFRTINRITRDMASFARDAAVSARHSAISSSPGTTAQEAVHAAVHAAAQEAVHAASSLDDNRVWGICIDILSKCIELGNHEIIDEEIVSRNLLATIPVPA